MQESARNDEAMKMNEFQRGNVSVPRRKIDSIPEFDTDFVFNSEHFCTYTSRILRKAMLLQFVPSDHMTVKNENKLINEAAGALSGHLKKSVPSWGIPDSLAKVVIQMHIRKLLGDRLSSYDMDDGTKLDVSEEFGKLRFEDIFPAEWKES